MQIERNELRCFHAVIEAGGFSRAAERLDLSQSAVSQAIANLEHRLGTSLLRRGNPPQPTEAGFRLLRFAQTTLNEERKSSPARCPPCRWHSRRPPTRASA
jgi:LysR family transcriptional regulator (chromosome initiation inhibitor)